MKKYIFLFTLLLLLIPFKTDAKEINMYLFYGDGCPHCEALEEYIQNKYSDDKEINFYKYEVWYSPKNQEIWLDMQNKTGKEAKGVPYLVIENEVIQGFKEGTSEEKIDTAIAKAKGTYIEKENKENITNKDNKDIKETITIPLIGTIDLSSLSLPVVAIIIGLVDGFNPCAMWILIFLITMLFNYPQKKKMWILGGTFLFTSAFIYFLFMISFLNLAMFLNKITIIKVLIALFALIFGIYNIYRFSKQKDIGCDVVDKTKRRKIMDRIKKIVQNKAFILSLIGIIILAVSVNIIELLCSLGLPVMYTEILAYNNVSKALSIIYILLYVFFFLLDDLIIFIIAMKTLKITAISNKYNKYSHLIGGIIMIIIGLLMLVKPEWLMFNF